MPRYRDVYELAGEVGGMYAVVVAAAKRAKQLREGRQAVVDCHSSNPLTIAIEELLEGKVLVRDLGDEPDEPVAETEVVEVDGTKAKAEAEAEAEAEETDAQDDEVEPSEDGE